MDKWIEQSPLIPLIFCSLAVLVILAQSFVKRRFYKAKLLFTFLITFVVVLMLVFDKDIEVRPQINRIVNWILLFIDIIVCLILLSSIELSLSKEKFHKELTKSIDETKFYVLLDKKERIKEISSLFISDLGIEINDAVGKNVFDVIELKYRIVGLNNQECYKKDAKKHYDHYERKVKEDDKSVMELDLTDENAADVAIYFNESLIFNNGKYRGRILVGDKKTEENLMGMEKDLATTNNELALIKNRFITLLGKTSEGIFFNNLTDKTIWFNDVLVQKLSLNGNSISSNEFYQNIHNEDIALYEDVMKHQLSNDYNLTYRYNVGSHYVYIKENGHRIMNGKIVELCGIMSVLDDYSYEKTDTPLDTVAGEPEMLSRLNALNKADKVFQVVHFKVASIPDINEQFGRSMGNMMLGQYVNFFKQSFVTENQLYRISGLEFVAFITDYRKMDILKSNLNNNEKILHVSANYSNQKIETEVFMGIAYSNDTPNPKDALKNAKQAMKYSCNPQFSSNYAYYRDIK